VISGLFLTSIGSELPFSWLDFGSLVLEPDIISGSDHSMRFAFGWSATFAWVLDV
jgi:hypothetical protein